MSVPVRLLLTAFLVFAATRLAAQRLTDRNAHLWITHLGDHRFADRWSIHTEAHVRRADLGEHWQQLLLRPAVNYHFSSEVMFTLGYSYYYNYPYGAYPIAAGNWEHNVFQQVQLSQRIGRLAVSHRFRMEERFLAQLTKDASDASAYVFDKYLYQSRFRYRVMATLPLGRHEKVEAKTWSVSVYDELFLNFGDSQRLDLMQQNRISALLGYQYNAHGNVQVGCLLQTIQRPGAAAGVDLQEMNSTLHLILTYNLDLRKPKAPPAGG